MVTGTSRLVWATPIMGPPESTFSGWHLKPSTYSSSSLYSVPVFTIRFRGLFTASPVTVTTRRISGVDSHTARYTAITVSQLSTIQPASAGSMEELIFRPVQA